MLRHDTDPETGDEPYYQEVRSRGVLIGVCATIGGFGLLFLTVAEFVRISSSVERPTHRRNSHEFPYGSRDRSS